MSGLSGKNILVGITGSIAAYKSALLVRLLVKEGASVKVVMTLSAGGFITPLTLATLSRNKVLSDFVDDKKLVWNNHVELGLWADMLIVAPASANTIAKFAHGLCDNLLTATYLSARCPVCIAPAMDEDMWKHPSTKDNLIRLQSFGNLIIPVDNGELASGLTGEGRMAEPENIVRYLSSAFTDIPSEKRLMGKKALVTAGPTHEAIDPVRFIGNHSSGKMGIAVAEALANEGAEVELILGPSSLTPANIRISTVHVTSANEMYNATLTAFSKSDITIMTAAVADYAPEKVSPEKIKKHNGDDLHLSLKKTRDILNALGKLKQPGQILAGFALETNDELENATEKIDKKNLDFIVLNSINDPGAGFQFDTNHITIIDKKHQVHPYDLKSKQEVAKDIVDFILSLSP